MHHSSGQRKEGRGRELESGQLKGCNCCTLTSCLDVSLVSPYRYAVDTAELAEHSASALISSILVHLGFISYSHRRYCDDLSSSPPATVMT